MDPKPSFTRFPPEYEDQIRTVFTEAFSRVLQNPRFFVEGRIEPRRLQLKVGYVEEKRLKQNNYTLRMAYDRDKQDAKTLIHLAVDALASLFEQHLERDESGDLPYNWKKTKILGLECEIIFDTINSSLEEEANALLGEDSEDLLYNEGPTTAQFTDATGVDLESDGLPTWALDPVVAKASAEDEEDSSTGRTLH